jgi:acyl-CoA thioesterase I
MALAAVVVAAVAGAPVAVRAQGGQVLAPVPKACETPGVSVIGSSPLPNVAIALKERKKINILAIGSTSASLRGPASGGHYAVVEQYLEATFKGLDVEVVYRGVSGELASDASERIKTEVALNNADLVLWQLGTADALAQVPVAEFYATVTQTIAWLKEHKVDLILVGLRYTRSMVRDLHYQAIRAAIQEVAKEQHVLRIGRYEAEETLERIRKEQGSAPMSQAEVSEASYVCMAEYLARAIAAGLFVRDPATIKPDTSRPPELQKAPDAPTVPEPPKPENKSPGK